MNFLETELPGVVIVESKRFGDDRGFFMETYHSEKFAAGGIPSAFLQDNHSRSVKGVLRGLHYQEPRAQGKLVRAVTGTIFDVAVDIRRGSSSFGKWVGVILSEENGRQLWVPPGFAHGFQVLSETADVVYKCTELYDPAGDRSILWSDPEIGIEWPLAAPLLSSKDAVAPTLAAAIAAR
jgi:dTDP-4-dehydrorhamnose 3,5-epimerase